MNFKDSSDSIKIIVGGALKVGKTRIYAKNPAIDVCFLCELLQKSTN